MSHSPARIRRVEFVNFKALSDYVLSLGEVNVLVGPNNSGKSTIIGALRTLDAAVRFARGRAPARIRLGDETVVGYRIPDQSVPISLENVQTDYNSAEARVTFHFANANSLVLIFESDGRCILVPRVEGSVVTSAAAFRRAFPVNLVIVPVLGPVEHNEKRRERDTVVAGLSTHRASRHFRSYWYYFPEGFEAFAELVESTWSDMRIQAPELDTATGELTMFCLEGRMTREIYWVGFGFQIWCQLLTHISRANSDALVIVDEPEVYLHPDVQRQLLGILRDSGADVLLATHSSEIIGEADPAEIVMVDKRRRRGERLRNIAGVQRALESVGSGHNIMLTALARSRRVLFVEGLDDFKMLRRFARKLGLQELSSGSGIIPLRSGGFGSWKEIASFAARVGEALGAPLMISAIYDRDYYCDEQIADVLRNLQANLRVGAVLARKEIENYLLVPPALNRVIIRLEHDRGDKGRARTYTGPDTAALLNEIMASFKETVFARLLEHRCEYLRKTGQNQSCSDIDFIALLERRWSDPAGRVALVPGKEVLGILRDRVQQIHGVTLTDARIAEAMNRTDIPHDMAELLSHLDTFRTEMA